VRRIYFAFAGVAADNPAMPPIESLADFTNRIQEHAKRLAGKDKGELLPIGGGEELVVMSRATYDRLTDLAECAEDLHAIREGLDQADRGEGRPAEEFFAEMAARHSVSIK
jgi:hypothetical protein